MLTRLNKVENLKHSHNILRLSVILEVLYSPLALDYQVASKQYHTLPHLFTSANMFKNIVD